MAAYGIGQRRDAPRALEALRAAPREGGARDRRLLSLAEGLARVAWAQQADPGARRFWRRFWKRLGAAGGLAYENAAEGERAFRPFVELAGARYASAWGGGKGAWRLDEAQAKLAEAGKAGSALAGALVGFLAAEVQAAHDAGDGGAGDGVASGGGASGGGAQGAKTARVPAGAQGGAGPAAPAPRPALPGVGLRLAARVSPGARERLYAIAMQEVGARVARLLLALREPAPGALEEMEGLVRQVPWMPQAVRALRGAGRREEAARHEGAGDPYLAGEARAKAAAMGDGASALERYFARRGARDAEALALLDAALACGLPGAFVENAWLIRSGVAGRGDARDMYRRAVRQRSLLAAGNLWALANGRGGARFALARAARRLAAKSLIKNCFWGTPEYGEAMRALKTDAP
jgi:hypothetical protein